MCVWICVQCILGRPWGWRALPVILPSLVSLPTYIHKACHVDQVAAGSQPFVTVKSVHVNVWLYNYSPILCLCLECKTAQRHINALPWIQKLLCLFVSQLEPDLFIMQFKEEREERRSPPESFMMDGLSCWEESDRLGLLWSHRERMGVKGRH